MKRTKIQKKLNETSKKQITQTNWKNQKKSVNEGSFVGNAMRKAKDFIRDKSNKIKKSAKSILQQLKKDFMSPKNANNFKPGKMLAINYKAKDATKKYDKNPLIICLGSPKNPKLTKTHTLGLNLHWMKMTDRVKVASFFVELVEKRGGQLQYEDVQPFMNKFKGSPVLRMYIIKNIGPKVIEMPSDQFMMAAAIPSEYFIK